jgi:hypothetical protein
MRPAYKERTLTLFIEDKNRPFCEGQLSNARQYMGCVVQSLLPTNVELPHQHGGVLQHKEIHHRKMGYSIGGNVENIQLHPLSSPNMHKVTFKEGENVNNILTGDKSSIIADVVFHS